MTPDKQTRPAGNRTGQKAFRGAEASIPDAPDSRSRCCECRHPLTDPRSIAQGFGPTCYARRHAAQMVERTAMVRGRLDALRDRLDALDVVGLDLVAVALLDLEDAIAEGAAS